MIPRLHIITDDEILSRENFLPMATSVLEAGGPGVAFHLRGPRSPGGFLFHRASTLRPVAQESRATLLVNDRLDVALALDLSGVHLGRRSLPAYVARKLLGPDRLVGVSVHGSGEFRSYGQEGDFLVVGTVFQTASHPDACPAGPEVLRELRRATVLPLLGIGGITPERISAVMATGAHGVAVRGAIWNAQDPAAVVGVFLRGVLAETHPGKGGRAEQHDGDHEHFHPGER